MNQSEKIVSTIVKHLARKTLQEHEQYHRNNEMIDISTLASKHVDPNLKKVVCELVNEIQSESKIKKKN
jgi:ferredoxin-fold anticodon binding domain-containing protein